MAVKLHEKNNGKILEVQVTGKLTHEDYQTLVPAFERLVKEHGKLRVLFEMTDFHGWDARALWDDIRFDLRHFSDIERLAMVGHKRWEHGMSVFCRPFTTATIRYFDSTTIPGARAWLEEQSS
jgi:stage II sporulation SpoAA-like protein